MRSLPKPTDENGDLYQPRDVFRLCISRVREAQLRARLLSVENTIATAAMEYDLQASTGALHEIEPEAVVDGVVTNEEMVKVYSFRMVPEGKPGRPVYERIKNAAPQGRCPLCDVGVVNGLDHQLPKSRFSCFAVTPNNLVPSCDWCQKIKDDFFPTAEGHQTIHPYFDDFETEPWLKAEIIEAPTPGFLFYVDAPPGWSDIRTRRAAQHLRTYGLHKLYSTYAADEVSSQVAGLLDLHTKGGAATVRERMSEEAEMRRASRLNSWRTATYLAAAGSNWFCEGGFRMFSA